MYCRGKCVKERAKSFLSTTDKMDNNACVICLVYLFSRCLYEFPFSLFEYWLMLMLIQSSFTFTNQYCLKLLAWAHWMTAFNCNQAERWCSEIDFFFSELSNFIYFFYIYFLHKYVLTHVEFSSASITWGGLKKNSFFVNIASENRFYCQIFLMFIFIVLWHKLHPCGSPRSLNQTRWIMCNSWSSCSVTFKACGHFRKTIFWHIYMIFVSLVRLI